MKQSNNYKTLIEPFAGGGIVSLTAAFENLANEIVMIELDNEVAAVWEVIVNGDYEWLADQIFSFDLTAKHANEILQKEDKTLREQAFSIILKKQNLSWWYYYKRFRLNKKWRKR